MLKHLSYRIGVGLLALALGACSSSQPRNPVASETATPETAVAATEPAAAETPASDPKLVLSGALYEGSLSGKSLRWDFRKSEGGLAAPRTLSEKTVAVDAILAHSPNGASYFQHTDESSAYRDGSAPLPRKLDVTIRAMDVESRTDEEEAQPQPRPEEQLTMSRVAILRQWQNGMETRPFAADFPDFVNGTPFQRTVSTLLSDQAREFAIEGYEDWGYRTVEVFCCSMNIVSITWGETRGAGGQTLHDVITHNYVAEGGGAREIFPGDLFLPGWEQPVSDLCIAGLRRHFAGVEERAMDLMNGAINRIERADLSRFVITPEGLTFFIDPDVIGGGDATESIDVAIPWNDLRPVLRAGGPVDFLTRATH